MLKHKRKQRKHRMYHVPLTFAQRWDLFWSWHIYKILHWVWVFFVAFLMDIPFLILMIFLMRWLHTIS